MLRLARPARDVGGVGGVATVSCYCGKYVDYNLSVRIRLHLVANLCELSVSDIQIQWWMLDSNQVLETVTNGRY